jgi:hypothetical protein
LGLFLLWSAGVAAVVVQALVVMGVLAAAAPMAETLAATFLGREKALLGKAIEVGLDKLLRLILLVVAVALEV